MAWTLNQLEEGRKKILFEESPQGLRRQACGLPWDWESDLYSTGEHPEVRDAAGPRVRNQNTRTKARPLASTPCASLHFLFPGKAVKSSSGILLPSSHSQSQHRLLTLGPGATPDSCSAGLALTQPALGVLSTRTRLDKNSRDGSDCVRTTHSLSLPDFGKGQPRDQDRIDSGF